MSDDIQTASDPTHLAVQFAEGGPWLPASILGEKLRWLAGDVGSAPWDNPWPHFSSAYSEVVDAIRVAGLLRFPPARLAVGVAGKEVPVPDLADRLRDLAFEAGTESAERRKAVRGVVEEAGRLGLLS